MYGDHPALPKVEDNIGKPLSPYAVSKRADEIYARVFDDCYGMETVGLRYFNVFGRRQDPNGPYAAVVPRWIELLASGQPCVIFGDGTNSRDFCYIDNVVQANVLAAVWIQFDSGASEGFSGPNQMSVDPSAFVSTSLNALIDGISCGVCTIVPSVML